MPENIYIPEHFDFDAVPINYQWSKYSANCEDFKANNFLKLETAEFPTYVCSAENGVALGDYLSTYILRQPFVRDMEATFSPGYDYWFFKAWEQAAPHYDELDKWVHKIVDLLIDAELITLINWGDNDYFLFSYLCTYESQDLPSAVIETAKASCEEELITFCLKSLDDYGDTDALALLDVGDWAGAIIQHFIATHQEQQ